jgi:hypothetical protein
MKKGDTTMMCDDFFFEESLAPERVAYSLILFPKGLSRCESAWFDGILLCPSFEIGVNDAFPVPATSLNFLNK